MKKQNINCIVDLGSKKIKCAFFSHENNNSKLIASSEKETAGIHNSTIINFDQACNSVRSLVADVEKKAGININNISVLIEPIEILVTHLTKFKRMEGSKIEKEDINFLLRESKKQIEKNDKNYSQIHILNSRYVVDKKVFNELPINIFCNQLSLENTFISIPKNILKNISEVFHNCELEIDRFISTSYANGLNLFNKYKLDQGCGVIDIGYEKTSIALFKNMSLLKMIVIPIGSNHITKDISKICYLNENESELIKLDQDLFLNIEFNEAFLPKKYFIESKFRKISLKFISDIISSRIDEIAQIIFKEIKNVDQFQIIKNNLIFIGEGSKIFNTNYCENFSLFDIQKDIKDKDLEKKNNSSLACYSGENLLVNGWVKEAIAMPFTDQKKGLFTRLFEVFN